MRYDYLPIEELPEPGTIIWCRWPHEEDKGQPGAYSRCVLVRKYDVLTDADGVDYGALTVSYGTGSLEKYDRNLDLFIDNWSEIRLAGLQKPTCFSLRLGNKKTYPWCTEYFAPQRYVLNAPLIAGKLNDAQRARLKECLKNRGLA